ncbi:hypothetical protein M9Y10_014056 [Tritrichomonas musculus]|uniref:Peptidase S8/S53 domain-containing protein n=1 Tax=Tritrichomonas musculus TaxID=1915356 RepID=A0ABR2L0E6_9EUKA
MSVSIFLFALFNLAFSYHQKDTSFGYSSFSFITSQRKEFTLSRVNQHTNIFTKLLRQIIKPDNDNKQWYYVNIDKKYISKAQKYVQILPTDEVIKNTFLLFLSPRQLEQISDYSLIKLLEPSDKIDEESPLDETNYLYVKAYPGYKLTPISDLFSIDSKNSNDSFIFRIDQNRLSENEFLQKKEKVVQFLSEISAINTISPFKKPTKENNINVGLLQKNDQPPTRDPYTSFIKYDRYVHNHGLTGEGEIITIEDTLIDFRHPMFRDEKVPIEFNKDMPNHRKILHYSFKGDMKKWEEGLEDDNHGTHTAGTLAGKSVVPEGSHTYNQLLDGSAPDAKIVYAGIYGEVTADELENIMNSHGSRISSNSWGDTDIFVSSLNFDYGSLAHRNPQSLFVFAAGNHFLLGNFSVCDPGGSKNVLAVAYSNNPIFFGKNQFTLQSLDNPDYVVIVSANFMINLIEQADFLGNKKGESKIIAVDARNDECEKMYGQHVTVLYGDNFDQMYDFVATCFINESLGLVMTENISAVEHLISTHERVAVAYNTDLIETNEFMKGMYSSTGPGNRGIFKPDVMAPGTYVVSARSYPGNETYKCDDMSTGCGISLKSGTSMATPIVAGGAALISQYFKSGKWIEKVDLDGSTLRALIINSCKLPFDFRKPDTYFGHGFVDLSTVLPLDDGFGVQITSQKQVPSISENGHLVAKIEVKSNKLPLQITMSYLDPMLNAKSIVPLTHDLDLVVVSPDGKVVRGDNFTSDTQHFSTNEKVVINETDVIPGTYTVHIYGNTFIDASLTKEKSQQNFSVVATGDIENKYISFTESSESPCEKADPNHPGFCLCANDEIGPICQAKIHHVTEEGMINLTLEASEIYRIKVTLNKKITSVKAQYDYFRAMPTVWISPSCHLILGEYEINGKIGAHYSNETKIPFGTNEVCIAVFANCDITYNYSIEIFGSDDDDNNNDDYDKLNKILIALICVFCVVFLVLVAIIIYIVVKHKKENNMNSGNQNNLL